MTIIATAQPLDTPPSVLLALSVPTGNVMTSVQLWRNDATGRHPTREQPSAGFESRSIVDYECPYEALVTYDWVATYFDPADNATTYSEPWSSFPGSWTGNTANASIASNRVTLTGSTSVDRVITRSGLNAAWDLISVAFLSGAATNAFPVLRLTFGTESIRLGVSGGKVRFLRGSTSFPSDGFTTEVDASLPITIAKSGSSITISDGTAAYTYTATLGNLTGLEIAAGANASAAVNSIVGAITAATFAATFQVAEQSDPVVVAPDSGWIIAPQAPVLSVPLSPDRTSPLPQVSAIGAIRNADQKTYHSILGTDRPVTTASAPQGSDETTLVVRTRTRDQEIAIRAICAPQLPVLIRFPPSFGYDFQDDFYAIGDLERARLAQTPDYQPRRITLPLTAVESPVVDVESVGWSWAALAIAYPTWAAVKEAYATWGDLVVDNRIGD